MAIIHLITGLPCGGKSTLAARLERDLPALRLTPDEWIFRIHGDRVTRATADRVRPLIEAALWRLALKTAQAGIDVVVDNGFWRRPERDALRTEAREAGVDTRLHPCEPPLDELLRRLERRNAALPPMTFVVDPDELRVWYPAYEVVTPAEIAGQER